MTPKRHADLLVPVGKSTCDVALFAQINFLAIFIIANLLTGVPNHTLDTIAVGDAMAMAILMAYMLAVTGIAVALCDAPFGSCLHLPFRW